MAVGYQNRVEITRRQPHLGQKRFYVSLSKPAVHQYTCLPVLNNNAVGIAAGRKSTKSQGWKTPISFSLGLILTVLEQIPSLDK